MGAKCIPVYGWPQYPHVGFYSTDNPQMDTAKVIASNLAHLMEHSKSLNTITAVAKASGVGFGTVQRARNGDGNLTVQNLELLAHAFRRTARDLLVDSTTAYTATPPAIIRQVAEPPPDERDLMQGYRDASPEVREIMLDLARKASKKNDCTRPVERND